MNSKNNGQTFDKKRIIYYGSILLGIICIVGSILSSVLLRDNLYLLDGVPYGKFQADENFNSIEFGDNNIYLIAFDGIETIDLNDTTEHNFTSFKTLGGDKILSLAYIDGHVFVRNWTSEGLIGSIRTYDISDPLNSSLLSTWEYNNTDTHDIFISGDTAFLAAGVDGLEIVNISDLSNPSYIGGYSDSNNHSTRVFVHDDVAYISDNEGLEIVDVSNLASPVLITRYDFTSEILDMYVEDGMLFLTAKNDTYSIEIVDISTPSNPTYIGEILNSIIYPKFEVINNIIYVASGNDFSAFDITDPSNPSFIARHHFGLGFRITDLHVSNDIAYILENNGLYFLSLTVQPFTITNVGLTLEIGLAVTGAYLVIIGLYMIIKGDNPLISFLINLIFSIFGMVYIWPLAINLEIQPSIFPFLMPVLVLILEILGVASYVSYYVKRKKSR